MHRRRAEGAEGAGGVVAMRKPLIEFTLQNGNKVQAWLEGRDVNLQLDGFDTVGVERYWSVLNRADAMRLVTSARYVATLRA
jgi:hypothetical protein